MGKLLDGNGTLPVCKFDEDAEHGTQDLERVRVMGKILLPNNLGAIFSGPVVGFGIDIDEKSRTIRTDHKSKFLTGVCDKPVVRMSCAILGVPDAKAAEVMALLYGGRDEVTHYLPPNLTLPLRQIFLCRHGHNARDLQHGLRHRCAWGIPYLRRRVA